MAAMRIFIRLGHPFIGRESRLNLYLLTFLSSTQFGPIAFQILKYKSNMVDSLLEKAPTNTKNPNFCYSWCYMTLKDFFNTRDFVHNLGITSREECDECCKSRNKEIFRGAIITICLCQIPLYTISFYCYKCYQVCFPVTSCYHCILLRILYRR